MNFYPHYIGDYQRDTGHLSIAEDGAYRRLLDTYYATERPLTTDWNELYLIARAMRAPEKAAVRKVVEAFFPIGADGLRHNARADREIAEAQRRIATARENGKRGGRPKQEPKDTPKDIPPETRPVTRRDTGGFTRHPHHQSPTPTTDTTPKASSVSPVGQPAHEVALADPDDRRDDRAARLIASVAERRSLREDARAAGAIR